MDVGGRRLSLNAWVLVGIGHLAGGGVRLFFRRNHVAPQPITLGTVVPRVSGRHLLGVAPHPSGVTVLRHAHQEQAVGRLRDVVLRISGAVGVLVLDPGHRG